ncbi:hypothetical protein ACFLTE_04490 [Bacteroidota bacterium]
MNTQNYLDKVESIKAIQKEEIKYPHIPMDAFLQETEDLFQWCKDDKEKLIGAGLSWAFIKELPIRAGACREAQSLWMKEYRSRQEAEKEWKEQSPEAYDLRDQLAHSLRYAFRKDQLLRNKVSIIRDGTGHADMIQDLNDLAVLGKSNIALLQAINFDITLLEKAAELADKMAVLLAEANGDKSVENSTKTIRDKAYTYLKEAVDEVRECGKYLFWRNPDRYKGYISQYKKLHN